MKILILETGEELDVPQLSPADVRLMLRFPPSLFPGNWGQNREQAPAPMLIAERVLRMLGAYNREQDIEPTKPAECDCTGSKEPGQPGSDY